MTLGHDGETDAMALTKANMVGYVLEPAPLPGVS